VGDWTVAALAVVNALGDVFDGEGRVVAGARDESGGFVCAEDALDRASGEMRELLEPRGGQNTTLAVVATDAPLDRLELGRLVRMACTALPRRISPVHTPFDGDVVFAVSTSPELAPVSSGELLALGTAARRVLEDAITLGVQAGGDG
jgi:L-aminopeptidase/D-esterase-like protein